MPEPFPAGFFQRCSKNILRMIKGANVHAGTDVPLVCANIDCIVHKPSPSGPPVATENVQTCALCLQCFEMNLSQGLAWAYWSSWGFKSGNLAQIHFHTIAPACLKIFFHVYALHANVYSQVIKHSLLFLLFPAFWGFFGGFIYFLFCFV